jgi:hypothetical protein
MTGMRDPRALLIMVVFLTIMAIVEIWAIIAIVTWALGD